MPKQKLQWHTEKRRVKSLVPCEQNPNVNTDAQFSNLKKSIDRDGYVEIIVVDIDGKIVAGEHRWRVLMEMGKADEEIDVRVPNRKLTKQEFDRYLIASNALRGSFDFEKLRFFDVNMLLDIGMDEQELAGMWDSLSVEDDDFDFERAIQKAKATKIKPGDLFQVGPHRIACGNSEDPAVVKRLVGDAKIDLVNIDPPYNVGIDYNAGVGGKRNYGGHVNDKKSEAEYRKFLKDILANAIGASNENSHFFLWCDERGIGLLQSLYKECGIDFHRLCTWLKGNFNPVPSIAFNKCAEWCVYGTRGSHPYLFDRIKNLTEVMNREVDSGNRLLDDINDLFAIWLAKRVPAQEMQHPTEKPPSLYEKSLRRCSKPGDAILDLCSGSGSVLVACEYLKRKAFLCDQEPIFCQVAIDRAKQLFHYDAKKII
jgi:DNA modification methylase